MHLPLVRNPGWFCFLGGLSDKVENDGRTTQTGEPAVVFDSRGPVKEYLGSCSLNKCGKLLA
jgi:hypothetical protein